jgi:hypothetical protein
LLIITQANKPTAARPPSMTAGGIGAAVMVSQFLQAYWGEGEFNWSMQHPITYH